MQYSFESRWFALLALLIVIASGICLYRWPHLGIWVLLPAIVMSVLRLVGRPASFHIPSSVASLVVFITTAAVGYTVAYDEKTAWNKFCLIIVAVLLYVNVLTQPMENLNILAGLGLLAGFGVASAFLLTTDFTALAVKFQWIHRLGVAWMKLRPNGLNLPSMFPNDTAGIAIIAGTWGLPLLRVPRIGCIQKIVIIMALGTVFTAVVLASSRGAFLGLLGALGTWFTWRLLQWMRSPAKEKVSGWFPYVVIAGILALEVVVLFLPSGLLGSSFSVSENVLVSRADVFRSGLIILRDFPFTGGGLASFPGLYSQYVMAMPFYLLPHGHNMILNVMIGQGVLGGIAFTWINLMAVRQLLSVKPNSSMQFWYLAACVSLLTALFHGMVDDYLYESSGPALALIPAGMAILVSRLGTAGTSVVPGRALPISPVPSISRRVSVIVVFLAVASMTFFWRPMVAQWYANIGAIKMAKVELEDFPTGMWSEGNELYRLDSAERDFQRALAYQTDNQTANHRMGLIRMLARDYDSASVFLQYAYEKDVTNRGVIKNLGYTYLWLGDTERAYSLLSGIPETKRELDAYIWWWNDRQHPDLSDYASQLAEILAAQP